MKIHSKRLIRFLIIAILLWTCKENVAQPKTELVKFKSECPKIAQGDFYWGKPCIKEKQALTCMKAIEEIKAKGIESYFFEKTWDIGDYGMKFHVSRKGEIKIVEHGPDGMITVWKQKGKIYRKDGKYIFADPIDSNDFKTEEFVIKRIDCEINNLNIDSQGSFIYFTFANNEMKVLRHSALDNSPVYGDSKSFVLAETTKPIQNFEVWHKISLILSE
ncbi:hypothetical protein EHQ23_19740 [Leptospira bourretii]|uniref:Uncharacterized protein n=1 Tax=Leptospira bourretii TaxID=2484962 RepID=A0A4R9IGL3_9LEPT|nr:hypothetical protein [Leptospira bourretii]TGK78903.1 hypothetical protein EHQ23_19740 [Leptospira bourretii]TGK87558.1 hypothetical protein EHQ26_19855 [Leptospira bourretii]TGL40806.1 hypothetical protein EHQ45_03190 [Leptospira bourretii]